MSTNIKTVHSGAPPLLPKVSRGWVPILYFSIVEYHSATIPPDVLILSVAKTQAVNMTYREYYAPTLPFGSVSQAGAGTTYKKQPVVQQGYYTPAAQPITQFHGTPFDTGIDPEYFADLHGNSASVAAVAFSPNGSHVAAGTKAGELRIWSVTKDGIRQDLIGHKKAIEAIAYSANGKWLASGSADHTIIIWNAGDGQLRSYLTGHTGTIIALSFCGNTMSLMSASEDRTIRLWDTTTGSTQIMSGQKPLLTAVAFSRDGELAALSSDGSIPTLKMFNLIEPQYRFLTGHGSVASTLAFSSDGKTLFAGLADCTIQYWDVDLDESIVLLGHLSPVTALAYPPNERLLISGSADHTVRIWNRKSIPDHLEIGIEAAVQAVSVSSDGKSIAVGLDNGIVRVFGTQSRETPAKPKGFKASFKNLKLPFARS